MFGKEMRYKGVLLSRFSKKQIMDGSKYFGDYNNTKYLEMNYFPTPEQESDWYDGFTTDRDRFLWGIYLEDEPEVLIGTTSIDLKYKNYQVSGSTGIYIWRPEAWGKGIATRAHKMRTWYAHWVLGLKTIESHVATPNIGSTKALEKVGYTVVGTKYALTHIDGRYVDWHDLQWVNPFYTTLLFPNGAPDILKPGLEQAQIVLDEMIAHFSK